MQFKYGEIELWFSGGLASHRHKRPCADATSSYAMNAQHLVLKVCMQLASSSAFLCFGIRQYAPHAITRIQFSCFVRSCNSRPWTQLHPELCKHLAAGRRNKLADDFI
jgi:hypothetical protein